MTRRHHIDRRRSSATAPEATHERTRAAREDCREVFDEFLSESATEPRVPIECERSRTPDRMPKGEVILSDTEAFWSEVAACASDRPVTARDVRTMPRGLDSFLSEDEASSHTSPAIAAPALEGSIAPPRVPRLDWLSTSMNLIAISASFFVAVMLAAEALNRANQALLLSNEPAMSALSEAAPIDPASAPLAARPLLDSARPARHAAVVASRVPPFEPPPPASSQLPAVIEAPPAVVESDNRRVELVPPDLPPVPPVAESVVPPGVAILGTVPAPAVPPVAVPPVAALPVGGGASVELPRPGVPSEADRIGHVLTQYRGAFNALDSAAARGVWPTVDERALGRAFAGLAQQEVDFQHCEIDVDGVRAAARCTGSARFVPKVGSRTPQTLSREWRFGLQKVDDRWIIEAVDAR